MVALLRLEWPVTGGKVAGAVALSKVPPQAMGLVHLFTFVFVLSEDLACHGTEPVGFVLLFGKGCASNVAKLSSGRPCVGPGRQGAQCSEGGQPSFAILAMVGGFWGDVALGRGVARCVAALRRACDEGVVSLCLMRVVSVCVRIWRKGMGGEGAYVSIPKLFPGGCIDTLWWGVACRVYRGLRGGNAGRCRAPGVE